MVVPSGLETGNIVALGIQLELEFRNVGFYGERQAREPGGQNSPRFKSGTH